MSLLTNATDTVTVYPEVESTDGDGNVGRVPDVTGVEVRCRVQPLRADEAAALGQLVSTAYRVIARSWPGGAFARVSWDGRDWDVIGEPLWSRGSEATRHVTVLLTARGPQGV